MERRKRGNDVSATRGKPRVRLLVRKYRSGLLIRNAGKRRAGPLPSCILCREFESRTGNYFLSAIGKIVGAIRSAAPGYLCRYGCDQSLKIACHFLHSIYKILRKLQKPNPSIGLGTFSPLSVQPLYSRHDGHAWLRESFRGFSDKISSLWRAGVLCGPGNTFSVERCTHLYSLRDRLAHAFSAFLYFFDSKRGIRRECGRWLLFLLHWRPPYFRRSLSVPVGGFAFWADSNVGHPWNPFVVTPFTVELRY